MRVLAEAGHEPRPFSRGSGGDLTTGEGLAEALDGANWVLHAASDPDSRHGAGDIEATRNLLAATGGVEHLLYLSIVGVDRIPYRYFYPFDFKVQLVAAQEVAERAGELLAATPTGDVVEFGGPEVLTVREAVDTWRDLRGALRVLPLPYPGKVAAAFRGGLNTTDRAEGRQTWREFVSSLD